MSDGENPGLWDEKDPKNLAGNATEKAVREAIEALHAQTPLTGMQQALAQVCVALGRNIDAGNLKGRAIANEATQLSALLDKLAGVELEDVDETAIPQATKDLINALAAPPRLDTPTASYATEL
jgi:hypothetical protein